jgi:hypothetical protein
MKFTSLSEAIAFYSRKEEVVANVSPYSSLAAELKIIPQNTNYINPPQPDVITYGESVWGIGKIIEISKPQI